MPWVRAEAPSDLKPIVASLLPQAEIWTASDETRAPIGENLPAVIDWAAQGQRNEAGAVSEGLIVVAGSLYLVADFYRLLSSQARQNSAV